MFERFTDSARQAVVLAQEESRDRNHSAIDTHHILLGITGATRDASHGQQVLETFGIRADVLRDMDVFLPRTDQQPPSRRIPFTPRARKGLELSLREALQLGHNYIGAEHILLGLIAAGGTTADILAGFGLTLDTARPIVAELTKDVGNPSSAPRSQAASPSTRPREPRAARFSIHRPGSADPDVLEDLKDWALWQASSLRRTTASPETTISADDEIIQVATGRAQDIKLAPSEEGQLLGVLRSTGQVSVWSVGPSGQVHRLPELEGAFRGIDWVQPVDGLPLLATVSADGVVRLWDYRTGDLRTELAGDGDDLGARIEELARQRQTAVAAQDYQSAAALIRREKKLRATQKPRVRLRCISALTTIEGQSLVAIGGEHGTVQVWDVATSTLVSSLTSDLGDVSSVEWGQLADGRPALAAIGSTVEAHVWDPWSSEPVTMLRGHTGAISSASWGGTRVGQGMLATTCPNDGVRIWDAATGECLMSSEWSFPQDPDPREQLDETIAQVQREKENAIDAEDFELAASRRDQEKRLLSERDRAKREISARWCDVGSTTFLIVYGGEIVRAYDPFGGGELAHFDHPRPVPAAAFAVESDAQDPGSALISGIVATSCQDDRVRIHRVRISVSGDPGAESLLARARRFGALSSGQAVVSTAVDGIVALAQRDVWPSVGLLADLILLTGEDLDAWPERLNHPELARLSHSPAVVSLRELKWAPRARVGLAALLLPEDLPAEGASAAGNPLPELKRALHWSVGEQKTITKVPIPPTGIEAVARGLKPKVLSLLSILGPEAVSEDPTLPLRLQHVVPYVPAPSPELLRLLRVREDSSSADFRRAMLGYTVTSTGAGEFDGPVLAPSGRASEIISTHLGLPDDVFKHHLATGTLLYRRSLAVSATPVQPRTIILDTTPATFGPVGTALRLLAHLITSELWARGVPPVLVTTGNPHSHLVLEEPSQLPAIWTSQSLSPPSLQDTLDTAAEFDQKVILMTHIQTALKEGVTGRPGLELVTAHTPGTPVPPPSGNTHHHHLSPERATSELGPLVASLLGPWPEIR